MESAKCGQHHLPFGRKLPRVSGIFLGRCTIWIRTVRPSATQTAGTLFDSLEVREQLEVA
jgi:hypothetical protein